MTVTQLQQGLSIATTAALVTIAVLAVRAWLSVKDRGRGWLALAIGSLALVSVAGQLQKLAPAAMGGTIGGVNLALFMLSGLALFLFRDTVIPLGRRLRVSAVVVTAVVTGVAVVFNLGMTATSSSQRPVQNVVLMLLVLVWSTSVGEPSVRFWLVSRRLPAVQRARLRALAAGYGAVVALLVVDVVAATVHGQSDLLQIFVALAGLVIAPLLYAGFAAPRWLRRLWRESEEVLVWNAIHDILMYSPDRPTLARRALESALRVAGGDQGFIVHPAGSVLAAHGLSQTQVREVEERIGEATPARIVVSRRTAEPAAIVAPVAAGDDRGLLVVLSGPFTPLFGTDEVTWLAQYARFIGTGLERVALTEALRAQTEHAEAAKRRLEAANKELEAFTYTVSHDLRAPLRAVNGFTAILMDEHAHELSETAKKHLSRVAENGKHMGALVDDLLAFSRLSRQALRKSSVRTTDVAQTAWNRFAGDLNGRRVDFRLSDLPVVEADPVLLEQVFTNLLSNAVKYSSKRQESRIEVGTQRNEPRDETIFYVKDNGVGFDMRYVGKLFGVFQRLHPSDQYDGTGVGLAIVQRIVERHGGRVWAEGEPDKGATFYFTLEGAREWQAAA